MEKGKMKQVHTRRELMTVGAAVAAVAIAGPSASAQTTMTTTATATPKAKKPPTSATPEMIDEAIQRSKARSAKFKAAGIPEQWGSEEPFTFVPGNK